MKKVPLKVQRCVTHHLGCPCHEWQFEEMERALKVIRTWIAYAIENELPVNIGEILRLCEETLESYAGKEKCHSL